MMTPLRKNPPKDFKPDGELIKALSESAGITIEEATAAIRDERKRENIWVNETYQVATIETDHPVYGPIMQINIRRRDGNVIMRDWREFQDIKNQLAGEECEAIELYPAESHLIDTVNKNIIFGCFSINGKSHSVGMMAGM